MRGVRESERVRINELKKVDMGTITLGHTSFGSEIERDSSMEPISNTFLV